MLLFSLICTLYIPYTHLCAILNTESDQVLSCIELCCKFKLCDKCIELCSIRSLSLNKLRRFRGKSLFHLYRREQEYLFRHSSTLNDQEIIQRRSSCYEKAEECIKLLGTELDQGCIDPEGSKMLDIAMLDYIREINKLYNFKRCLLCRKKRGLMKSHLWPRSFLRRYSCSRMQDISSKIFISFNSLKPREKSAGEVIYWMLCGECEQRISQNGEDKFATEIYDMVSSASENDIKIPYGPWLYNFSIGLIFRTFLYYCSGIFEHYLIFQWCREHILTLPVRYKTHSTYEEGHNATSVKSLSSVQEHQGSDTTFSPVKEETIPVIILANPTKLNTNHPRKSMLIGALFDAGSAVMSGKYLTTGNQDLSGQKHFIVVRLGNLSFLLPLKLSTDYSPPDGSLINPQGGELFVPGEDQRWNLIPEGLWVAIDSAAKIIEKTSLHHYAYKSRTGHWKSHSVEEQELPILSKELGNKERLLHKRLKEESGTPESSLVSRFLNTAYPSLNFLPDEIKLFQRHEYTKKGYLQLPSSHAILFHININWAEDSFTIFFVAKFDNNLPPLKTYVIFSECIRGVQMAYGAYITVINNKICITDSLIEMKKFSKHHVGRFEYYCPVIEDILPLFLKQNGYEHIRTLTLRAEVTRLVWYTL